MPSTKTLLTATQPNSAAVFDAFKLHCDAPRVETRTTILTQLRSAYPDHHVTEAEERRVSLFEFAAATDKAVLNFDDEGEGFQATRDWRAVGEGIEKKVHPGRLRDEFRFARFQYIWEDNEYLIYYVQWQDMFKAPDKIFYILYARNGAEEPNINDGHCAETDALILAAAKWTSQLHDEIFVFDDGRWEKSKELWRSVNGASWADVILDPEMKKGLIEDVQGFFDNQQLYAQFATVSIKALMSSLYSRTGDNAAIPSLYVKSFETNCNTEQYSIRAIFQKARDMAPCLLIFEDLDSLVNDDIRSYFLNEVDGLESNDGILMIGSTNHLDKLDPAIAKRPSRFDRKYHFKIPGEEERRLYAEYWRGKLVKNDTVEFPEELAGVVAKLTEGFSFAYLKELFVMALLSLGDDFEIVEAEEAASADDGEKKDESAKEKEASVDVCTCAKTCPTCSKPLPSTDKDDSEEAKKQDEAAEANAEAKKNKMVMPTVDVPEHLAENLLLKVIKHQIRILHAEMDNTEDGAKAKKVKGGKTDGRAAQMRRLMRANAARRLN
ncbi:hypothetical protein N0V83_007892 [Neocucurbitaria cava]|uniref:ATPase AAA-type core domain-containing protein n=1 Tax=Neocucurbitaria cava TaxID=798079 RepID=A0A9W9CJX7_9PLEO|nr:hypothetical protein N0V83_007892 [Neocucurbitaria cava]